MTDEITNQPQGVPTPASEPAPAEPAQPVSPAPVDVESLVSTRLSEWEEKRIKPLQTMLNEKNEEIKRLKTASMSEEQREQLEIEEQQRYVQELETRAWLAEKRSQHPDAAEMFQKVLGYEDPEEQIAFFVELAERLKNATPAAPAQPEASDLVPDVDPNNPAPRSPLGQLPTGEQMTREMRHRILKQVDFMDA